MGHDNMTPAEMEAEVQRIYDIQGDTLKLDLSRQRHETGLTFSKEALDQYANTIATFVTTRVLRYWNERQEPPVRMQTYVTVGIDHTQPVIHDPDRTMDLLDEALSVARSLLTVHEHVAMDTPEDKALHAKACQTYREAITAIERLRLPHG